MKTEQQFVSADKVLRQQVIIGLVIFSVAGALFINGVLNHLDQIGQVNRSDPKLARDMFDSLLGTVRIANAVLSLVFALYFGDVGMRILSTGRFPPKGMRVIKDTKIQFGARAKMTAIAHFAIALIILSTNLIFSWVRAIFENLAQR